MKGLVFTEFLEMVSECFSPDMVEKIIEASGPELKTQGAYTSVGTYDHKEMIALVTHLSQFTNIPVSDLEKTYGEYLFRKLVKRYPEVIAEKKDAFSCLESVDNNIHIEVRKLYPDAELPTFNYERLNPNTLVMDYHSTRPFADLAEGLMIGCIKHYKENIAIEREAMTENKTPFVRFTLHKRD